LVTGPIEEARGPPATAPAARNPPLRPPPDRRCRGDGRLDLHHPVRAPAAAPSPVGPGWTPRTGTGPGTRFAGPAGGSRPAPAAAARAPGLRPVAAGGALSACPSPVSARHGHRRAAADALAESSVSGRTCRMAPPACRPGRPGPAAGTTTAPDRNRPPCRDRRRMAPERGRACRDLRASARGRVVSPEWWKFEGGVISG